MSIAFNVSQVLVCLGFYFHLLQEIFRFPFCFFLQLFQEHVSQSPPSYLISRVVYVFDFEFYFYCDLKTYKIGFCLKIFLQNLLRIFLSPNVCSFLENVPCADCSVHCEAILQCSKCHSTLFLHGFFFIWIAQPFMQQGTEKSPITVVLALIYSFRSNPYVCTCVYTHLVSLTFYHYEWISLSLFTDVFHNFPNILFTIVIPTFLLLFPQ